MDESTRFGEGIADDHEFEVAQDGEIPAEAELESGVAAADADERPVGDDADDDLVGIDEERRVPLPDEPGTADDED
ncbi:MULTISPECIES: hypothetical protein [unclassified Agromyces]|uniref:hypothetical protein n=1 Tax=unclassified Agromyces TaxID=2639701 RepID=UPI003014716D